MSRAGGYEATEASLPEWTRPEVIDWTTPDEFSRGKQPADLPLPPRTAPRMMRRVGDDGWVATLDEAPDRPSVQARARRVLNRCAATTTSARSMFTIRCCRPEGHSGRHRGDTLLKTLASWR